MNERRRSARPPKRPSRTHARVPRFAVRLEVPVRLKRLVRRSLAPLRGLRIPPGAGFCSAAVFLLAAVGYGAVAGGHMPALIGGLKGARDSAANAVGFAITQVSIAGNRQLSERDVLAAAGITERTALLFLDVADARGRLMASPWIAQAAVRKFYPGRLQIDLQEREAFALWQTDGKIHVVSADGTVLAPLSDRRFAALPLVVGRGAGKKAKDFLAMLDRHPALRDQVHASILVADRRWNLKLKNGTDVRLPETDPAAALAVLAALDRDKQLLTRDITAIDLRLPDRVTVRLSDTAAQARDDLLKGRKGKRKGGDA
jgi:cell division protein FtsQ